MNELDNKSLGNLGWVTIVLAIVSTVVGLAAKGYPIYDALKTAKQMQSQQRILTEKENIELAEALTQNNPVLSYDQWLDVVKATNQIYPPLNLDGTPKPETNYWTYAIIFVAILAVTKK